MTMRLFARLTFLTLFICRNLPLMSAEPPPSDPFAKGNLVAWCIVPFDSKKRGPEERAAMLDKLGFKQFAYDYRAEHIPTFDAEIEALKRHHIELAAWWFPTVLNDEAKMTLELFARHKVTPQLWVTGGGEPTKSDQEQMQRVRDEASRIRVIAEAAAKVGCKVALYNHGGWFGEPDNQIAIIRELNLPNVGIVYNLHHGHDHLDRFPELLRRMMPYLYTLNLNGMVKDGERKGQKILQLGEGELDLAILKIIRQSGYTGPIGILGHTSDDAEDRLKDNLDGLEWLRPQLNGQQPGPKPKMRTPVPVAIGPAANPTASIIPRLTEGKFGKAIDGRAGGAFVEGKDAFRQFPITIECWTKLTDKTPYNILVAHEAKSSGTHWELFSMAGSGTFTTYTPGFTPDHCHSDAMICDGKWHYVAAVIEVDRIRLFVDGKVVVTQAHRRTEMKSVDGNLALASLVDQEFGCTGLLDEVRISRGTREITKTPERPFDADESTIGLWHLDELVDQQRFDDESKKNPARLKLLSAVTPPPGKRPKIEGHWGEDALGFRWTEEDSRDDRLGQMDTGPFFSGSITGAGGIIYKGIVVRLGEKRTASICYDTELLRASAGWTGFLKFDAARYGIIVPPRIEGDVTFTNPLLAGWSRSERFLNFRESSPYGMVPKSLAHYEGLYRNGQRVVLKFTVGTPSSTGDIEPGVATRTEILETPWLEELDGTNAISRTLRIGPSTTSISMLVAESSARVRLVTGKDVAVLQMEPGQNHVIVIPARSEAVTVKLLIASANVDQTRFEKLAAVSPQAEDLSSLVKPGPTIWGEPLLTTGEVSNAKTQFAVDTITLPFENRFKALMFCGGHDFLPDGRACVCTLHGDVWLVDGIDESLKRITWRRFATGLFQPLGVKIVTKPATDRSQSRLAELYVVGRDQITRLHDFNGDGEADFYENFNNDAYVSLNGHEYVTCLETDRAGNFYFMKGNCDSAIPHDGSVLRVSADGTKLDVFATGFRNSNGIGIGPNDEITVAPQEGEWTPASAVYDVRQGGFYGGMMSHHRPIPPTDFERPFCWFPRLADNSCGGQVWVPAGHWGPLANQLLHLSYGQCKLRLLLREPLPTDKDHAPFTSLSARRSPLVTMNGGSTEFPMSFASGIHRGRFNQNDGHLYLTGLKGWVTNAVNDGCFQRVRFTGQPIVMPIGLKTYRNGVALTFASDLDRKQTEEIDNYQVEAWNYHWSSSYGSPDLRASAPGQVGRDAIEPKSVTLLEDNRTVFIEIPDIKPVDQLGITYTLSGSGGSATDQTAYLTLNAVPNESMPEDRLHRSASDFERLQLIASLVPGLLFQSTTTNDDVRSRRLVAWPGSGPNAPQGPVVANGYLKVPATADYKLSADTESPVTVSFNGEKLVIGKEPVKTRLRKGLVNIAIEPLRGRDVSSFRLMWESSSFPRETVPATALFHAVPSDVEPVRSGADSSKFIEGRTLFADLKCMHCHVVEQTRSERILAATEVERQRQAPSLEGIGSRLNRDWLAAWLRNPTHLRADATMPVVAASEKDDSLADLVAYLASLHELPTPQERLVDEPKRTVEEQRKSGGVLFESLGCIACHTFAAADTNSDWHRVSLQFVSTKFQSGQLVRFLLAPHRFHAGSHMPDFHLSVTEATSLAAHLEHNSKGTVAPLARKNDGDLERGKKMFEQSRCDRCHQVSGDRSLAKPNVPLSVDASLQRGCLAMIAGDRRGAPGFPWTESQRDSLLAFLSISFHSPIEASQPKVAVVSKLLKQLRCNACHSRDGSSAAWPEIVSEEGSGKLTETVPQLTWVGEKLQGPWIEKLLKGDLPQKTRPWIKARMPSFPAYASLIAHGFADEHGVLFSESIPVEFDDAKTELGRRLTLRDGGLDCRQCHGVGKELPQGDVNTQIALGINFGMIRERLRPEFALRQMLDPTRYDNGSRMPRFAPDLKTTAAKHIEGGDARKQFEAIKQYLWSLKLDD